MPDIFTPHRVCSALTKLHLLKLNKMPKIIANADVEKSGQTYRISLINVK